MEKKLAKYVQRKVVCYGISRFISLILRHKPETIGITLDEHGWANVKDLIAKKGIDKAFGARPLKRTIQNLVEDKIAEAVLDGVIKKGKLAKVDCEGDEVVVK